jgi:hypothetical protein
MIAAALLLVVVGVGLFTYALCRVAGQADEAMENWSGTRAEEPEPEDWTWPEPDLTIKREAHNGTENRPC